MHASAKSFLAVILGISFSLAPELFAASSGLRTVKVGVAVSPAFQQEAAWKDNFLRRLDYASKIFEREAKIKFSAVKFWTWNPPENKEDTGYLLEDLVHRYPLAENKEIDIVIGLTRLTDPKLLENLRDVDTLGIARPFSGYLLLRYPLTPLFKVQQETVMSHELGHIFGAIHTQDPLSIMAPVVKTQIPVSFDDDNREILSLIRTMNFRTGLESLPAADIQKLIQSYLRLIAFDQRDDFYYSIGVFYLKLGQKKDAAKAWEKALKINPDNARIHYDLGILDSQLGDQEAAIKHLNHAAQKLSHPALAGQKAQALIYLGNAYFQKNNLNGAYQAWSNARVLAPKNPNVSANLAVIHLAQQKWDQAISLLQEVLKENPKNAKALNHLGFAYFKKGDFPKALSFLEKALKLTPKQTITGTIKPMDATQPSEIFQNLGSVYWKMNDKKKAIQYLRAACQMNPSGACHQRIGMILYEMQNYGEAIGELATAVQAGNADPHVYGTLGVALAKTQEDQKAIAVFQEGIQKTNNKKTAALFHKNIANLYMKRQQWDFAVREFQLAVAGDWQNTDCHIGLAFAYRAQNRLPEARQTLLGVLQMDPKNARAKQMIAEMDQTLADRQRALSQQNAAYSF